MNEDRARDDDAADEPEAARFKHLPEPVRLEDTVTSQETGPVQDPDGGLDPERDFMIRYSG